MKNDNFCYLFYKSIVIHSIDSDVTYSVYCIIGVSVCNAWIGNKYLSDKSVKKMCVPT